MDLEDLSLVVAGIDVEHAECQYQADTDCILGNIRSVGVQGPQQCNCICRSFT